MPDAVSSGIALLFLVAQPLVFYRKVLFNPRMFIPFDLEGFHLPLAAYIGRCVREGIFPFWDPYPLCGMPIHADLQAQLYYPLTWISILLGNLTAGHKLFYWMEWLIPLHMILAGVFTFLLLREFGVRAPAALAGGTVYQLGGYFASQAQHLGAVSCGAWLPLVLLCVLKLSRTITGRWIAALGLSASLSILGGFTPATLVVFGAAAFFTMGLGLSLRLNWKFYGAVLGGWALGAGITAIQIIPTAQLARQSVAALRYQFHVTGGGLRLQSLASLVVPNYYHIFTPSDPALYKLPFNFIILYVYCGIIPLALLLLAPFLRRAPYARMFFFFSFVSAIWMLGDETPFYRFVYTHLPRMARGALYADFALMAFCMFVALTSAVALDRIAARAPAFLVWGVALLTAADLTYFGSERPMNSAPGSYNLQNSEYQIAGDSGALERLQELVSVANPPLRVDYLDKEFWPAIWGSDMMKLPTADGDNPFMLQRVLNLRRLFCSGAPWERQIPVTSLSSPLINMLNVGFLAGHLRLSRDQLQHTRLALAHDLWGFGFYRNPDVLPRFFLVRRLHISSGEGETFSYLAHPGFAPAEEAVVEAKDLRPDEPLANGTVRVERYSPNRIELNVLADGRAFLASSEVLYPGWRVTVNGQPGRFYMTNGAFRGVMLNGGANHIVMTYWPERFLIWTAISAVSLVLALAGLIFGGSRQEQAFSVE